MNSVIAHKLKLKMKAKNIRAIDLHNKTHIPKSTISEILNSKTTKPCVYTMLKFSKALDCKIEDLI